MSAGEQIKMSTEIRCGWVQINNTVVPYIRRYLTNSLPIILVPLPVVQYGAGLFIDEHIHMQVLIASDAECKTLNTTCLEIKLEFTFEGKVELVSLCEIVKKCSKKVMIAFLPDREPFGSAKFIPEVSAAQTALKSVIEEQSTPKTSENPPVALDLSKKSPTTSKDTVIDKVIARKNSETDNSSNDSVGVPLDLTSKSNPQEDNDVEFISLIAPIHNDAHSTRATFAPEGVTHIQPVKLHGRTVPCIIKAGVQYILVETIRRAYFNHCTFRAFMFMVHRSVSPFIYDLNQDDISMITKFAKNPTCLMKCPKVICINDAEQMIPMIRNFLVKVQQYRSASKHCKKRPAELRQAALQLKRMKMVGNAPARDTHTSGTKETLPPGTTAQTQVLPARTDNIHTRSTAHKGYLATANLMNVNVPTYASHMNAMQDKIRPGKRSVNPNDVGSDRMTNVRDCVVEYNASREQQVNGGFLPILPKYTPDKHDNIYRNKPKTIMLLPGEDDIIEPASQLIDYSQESVPSHLPAAPLCVLKAVQYRAESVQESSIECTDSVQMEDTFLKSQTNVDISIKQLKDTNKPQGGSHVNYGRSLDVSTQSDNVTPQSDNVTPQSDNVTPQSEDTTLQSEYTTPPSEGITPPSQDKTSQSESTTSPSESTTSPSESTTSPSEGTTSQIEDTTPTTEDTKLHSEGTISPSKGTLPPSEGTISPSEGTIPPSEGTVPPLEDIVVFDYDQSPLPLVIADEENID